jgi:VNT family MFS transporter (synaptic vesicle glycoprotein 2)
MDQSQSLTEDQGLSGDTAGTNPRRPPGVEELYAIPPFDELLGSIHEKALAETGFGKLQWILFFVTGCGLMGDSIELMMVAYILPGAEKDMCMDEQMKGWLGKSSLYVSHLIEYYH